MIHFRSRTTLAIVGMILLGALGAAIAVMTAPQPSRAALAATGQQNASSNATSTGSAMATATRGSVSAPPTTAPASRPTSAPSGQLVDLQGVISSVDTNAGAFYENANGSNVKVVVTNATGYEGSASSLSGLRSGWQVEVKGTHQADGSFLATLVHSDSGA
ncbi:MAG TPA: DUF5666 domain-containing protein [Ktedonobacterales bacterium]